MSAMQIDFPWHFDSRGRTASAEPDDHIRDLIEQFLLTNVGERVNRPDFGSGLMQLLFGPNTPELAATVQFTVQAGLERWLGDIIAIQNLDVTAVESTLTVDLTYVVRRTGQQQTVTITQTV